MKKAGERVSSYCKPLVKETAHWFYSGETEKACDNPISLEPLEYVRKGLFADQHSAIRKHEVHRPHARCLLYVRKPQSKPFLPAWQQLERVLLLVFFNPERCPRTHRTRSVINEHGFLFFHC